MDVGGNKFYEDEETGEDMIEDEVFRKRRFKMYPREWTPIF